MAVEDAFGYLSTAQKDNFDVAFRHLATPIFLARRVALPTGDLVHACVTTLIKLVFDAGFDKQLKEFGGGCARSPNYNVIWARVIWISTLTSRSIRRRLAIRTIFRSVFFK